MALSDAYVEAIHCSLGAMLDQELDRVGGPGDGVFYDRVHPREHIVSDRDSCRRTTDTDAHPDEVIAQCPYDGTQAVVPARAASDLDAHCPRFQVEVVVDDDEVLGPVVRDGGACVVHKRRRLEEGGIFRTKGDGGYFGLLPLAPGAVVTLRELVGDQVAGVVTGAFVGAPRVTESDDEGGPDRPPFVVCLEEGADQSKPGRSVPRGPPRQHPPRTPLHPRQPPRARQPPRRPLPLPSAPRRCRRPPSPPR